MAKDTAPFTFKIETSVPLPERRGGGGGQPKYDWSQFPAPTKEQAAAKTFPSALMTDVKNAKTFYTSIKRYRDRLTAEGTKEKDLPEFTVSKVIDAKGKLMGFRVFRVK